MKLKNKVAWITGGASGMGKEIARELVDVGAKVMITDIQEELGQEVAASFGQGNAIFVKADVTNEKEMAAAGKTCYETFGHMDILVNSAGGSTGSWLVPQKLDFTRPEDIAEGHFDFVVDMEKATGELNYQCAELYQQGLMRNLGGGFIASQVASHYMLLNDPDENGERGCIILIASVAANKHALMGAGIEYSSAKAGVLGLTKEIARICGSAGIRCNTILPGSIFTPMTDPENPKNAASKDYLSIMANAYANVTLFPPKKPKYGLSENIATMALEIMRNWFVNCAIIPVDGGFIGL